MKIEDVKVNDFSEENKQELSKLSIKLKELHISFPRRMSFRKQVQLFIKNLKEQK